MRKLCINFLIVISMILILSGCSSFNSMADEELVRIAKSYYSYYMNDKSFEMAVVERSKYEKKCDCYPVQFIITRPRQSSVMKTLYFYKNDSGNFDVRKYANGIKFVSN